MCAASTQQIYLCHDCNMCLSELFTCLPKSGNYIISCQWCHHLESLIESEPDFFQLNFCGKVLRLAFHIVQWISFDHHIIWTFLRVINKHFEQRVITMLGMHAQSSALTIIWESFSALREKRLGIPALCYFVSINSHTALRWVNTCWHRCGSEFHFLGGSGWDFFPSLLKTNHYCQK